MQRRDATVSRAERAIRAQSEAMRSVLKAAVMPPPPPPTLGQRVAAWFWRDIVPPLAQVFTIVGIAYAARIGWDMAG